MSLDTVLALEATENWSYFGIHLKSRRVFVKGKGSMMCVEECTFPSLGIMNWSWQSLGEPSVAMLGVPWLSTKPDFARPSLY